MRLIFLLLIGVVLSGCDPVMAEPSEVVLQTIAMESANQSDYGMYLVAHVIVNRSVVSHKSLEVVCKAPRQFSCWNDRIWASRWLSRHFDTQTRLRAVMALERARNANKAYPGITHYHRKDIRPYWAKGHKPSVVVGSHAFYEEIK